MDSTRIRRHVTFYAIGTLPPPALLIIFGTAVAVRTVMSVVVGILSLSQSPHFQKLIF